MITVYPSGPTLGNPKLYLFERWMSAVAWSDLASAREAVMPTGYRLMKRADGGYWLVQARLDRLPKDLSVLFDEEHFYCNAV